VITREVIDKTFTGQRQLTNTALEGPGLVSYFTNLGFDVEGMFGWAHDYALGNLVQYPGDLTEEDVTFVASLLTRALALGLILGRENQP